MCGACAGRRWWWWWWWGVLVQVPIRWPPVLHSFCSAAFLWKAVRSEVERQKMSVDSSAACMYFMCGRMHIDRKRPSRDEMRQESVCQAAFTEHPGMYVHRAAGAPSSTANSCSDTCVHSWVCTAASPQGIACPPSACGSGVLTPASQIYRSIYLTELRQGFFCFVLICKAWADTQRRLN